MNPIPKDTMQRALRLMDWLLEHQRQCWMLLTPGAKTKQADPVETAIMQVVVKHADTITANGGKIASAVLNAAVRKKTGLSTVSDKRLANAALSLKLVSCKLNGNRARAITAEQIEVFRATVRSVQRNLPLSAAKHFGQSSASSELSAGVLSV
jgi:hypothetical protein